MKKAKKISGVAKYLIISSTIALGYMIIYIYVLTPMPFIQNSSIFDTSFTGASFCLLMAVIVLFIVIPINVIIAVIYSVFKATKKKNKSG